MNVRVKNLKQKKKRKKRKENKIYDANSKTQARICGPETERERERVKGLGTGYTRRIRKKSKIKFLPRPTSADGIDRTRLKGIVAP